ncbi:MAG: hypothetical protein KBD52_02010 [Candidatus Pacebacteria bacterium]|nr:hypothetical protein [Candidatus Paceibacterota bacterium]
MSRNSSATVLFDLEQDVRKFFPEISEKEEKKVDDLLKATLWLYDSGEDRVRAIEEAFFYLEVGGRNLQLFFALLSYRALDMPNTRLKIIRNTFMNRIRVDDDSVSSLSAEDSIGMVINLWDLIWGQDTVLFVMYLINHKDEEGLNPLTVEGLLDALKEDPWL